ncbi:conserved oligomeric Golgi complex subunit 4 [Tanacetum coccineum]
MKFVASLANKERVVEVVVGGGEALGVYREKSRGVAEDGRRVLCYVQGSIRRKKKNMETANQRRLWDPGIKSVFQDNTLRASCATIPIQPKLSKHLSNLQSQTHLLDLAKLESDTVLRNVESTRVLADQLSGKVRELDLAQSRVNDTLLRIDAIVEKSACIDGVTKALDVEDYENAANYVKTFLNIDSKYKDSGKDDQQRETLFDSKKRLEAIVRRKLANAVDQRDHESVVRFIKLFSPLGLEEEGLQVYVSYLKKVISVRSKVGFEELVERMGDERGNGNKVDFVGCLTNLFKDIVLAIEENDEILRSLCGEDGIVYAICELQDECDSRGSLVLKKYMEYKKLSKLTSEINAYKNDVVNGEDVDGPDPREIELFLEEIHILRFPTIYHT